MPDFCIGGKAAGNMPAIAPFVVSARFQQGVLRFHVMKFQGQTIRVWDPLLRCFHWLLVIAVLTAYWFEGGDLRIHGLAGSLLGGLLVFRLYWGIAGIGHARFSDFFPRWPALKAHAFSLFRGRPLRYPGHTPWGSVMIFLLLFTLMFMYGTGSLLLALQLGVGPWAGWIDRLGFEQEAWLMDMHERVANVLIGLVIVHVAGVIVESRLQKVNLVGAMFTGYKVFRSKECER